MPKKSMDQTSDPIKKTRSRVETRVNYIEMVSTITRYF